MIEEKDGEGPLKNKKYSLIKIGKKLDKYKLEKSINWKIAIVKK